VIKNLYIVTFVFPVAVFVALCWWNCRQPGDDNKMLVCDTCDKGYHTFCLMPVMTTIPKNGWKCKVGKWQASLLNYTS